MDHDKMMSRAQILHRIIDEEGSCDWAQPSVCANCPLSKLKRKADGSWYSCIEAVGIENLTEQQANAKYKLTAVRLLLDDIIDDMLGEDL